MTKFKLTYFVSPNQYAEHKIDAANGADALRIALETPFDEIVFEPSDVVREFDEVSVTDVSHEEVAVWRHPDFKVRCAGPRLLSAAKLVVERWSEGDLADAVRELSEAIETAEG